VQPTSDGFVVPMPWGEKTDWCRNVRTAGECVIRWKGRDYPMVDPQVIDTSAEANAGFNGFERAALVRFGISQALRLQHKGSQ
jgi:hypothetical protein